jgi:hypothetical protein
MKLEFTDVHFMDSLHCPSTNETIFGPGLNWNSNIGMSGLDNAPLYRVPEYDNWDLRGLNQGASAFIGCWHDESDVPVLKDEKLKNAWIKEWGVELPDAEYCRNFLKKYDNPDWKALECKFYNEFNEEVNILRIYVVKIDCYIVSHD